MEIYNAVITPEKAKSILETKNNINVRKMRIETIARYARQMADGNWHDCWDCLAFDKDGNLLNGQHRLAAVVRSNTPIKALVITGAENITGDTGLKRNVVEELKGRGIEIEIDYSNTFGIAVLRDISSIYLGKNNATSDECVEISKFKALERCKDIIKIISQSPAGIKKACVASAIIGGYIVTKDSRCIEFCEILKTGISDNKSVGVVIGLRDFLMKTTSYRGGVKNTSTKEIRIQVQSALRRFLNGSTSKRINKEDNLIYSPSQEMFDIEW